MPGNLTLQGSAIDAGRDLSIQTSGDLQLLAAYSQSRETTQRTRQTSKKLETLNFDLEQTRALLATLSAGNNVELNIGGSVAAQVGSTDAAGNLQADRMTAAGVVRGGERQQVSLTHTDDKAGTTTNGPTSKVLGDLAAQGIRSGAADSFAPAAVQQGEAAVAALLQNGLINIRNQPGLQAVLATPTGNGAALTYKDDAGRVSLTLAGQAQVQAVYNQLKLTETFDVKHFANQNTAQVVTLVAAVALTVCTGGTGAGTLGAALAGEGATAVSIGMINAAFIAMTSTMTGQLAGGASFEDAFQAGLKAGATAAVSSGIASGIDSFVNTPATNTTGATANTAANTATPTTINSGPQVVQAGTNAAQTGLNNLDRLTSTAYWQQTTLNALAQGTLTNLQGGDFVKGATGSMLGSLSATGAASIGDFTANTPLTNIVAHAVLGCAVAAAGGKDCGAGAVGGASSATLARLIDAGIADVDLSQTAKNAIIAGGSVAGSTAIAAALGKDTLTAGNAAGNEVLNNALSHQQASRLAEKLQACAGATQCINDAVYNAILLSNKQGSSIDQANAQSAVSLLAQLAADPTLPLSDTNRQAIAILTWKNVSDYLPPTTNTSGSDSAAINQTVPQYAIYYANGHAFSLPVAPCPAAGCVNGAPIAWASTNPADQQALGAYQDALTKQQQKGIAAIATSTAAIPLTPMTTLGVVGAGGAVGGSISASDQYIDTGSVDAGRTALDAAKSTVVTAATLGVVKSVAAVDAAMSGVGATVELFPNLAPAEQIVAPRLFPASQIQSVGYNGRLNYVVTESGDLILGKTGHISLSQGADVLAAGEARFVNGTLRSVDNASGHYKPSGASAQNAAEAAFNRAGFNASGKYTEKSF